MSHQFSQCQIEKKPNNSFGFTLIELLVGLSLGIFITGVAFLYFVSSSQTFRVQTNESLIQENARFAIEVLTQNLRLAGLNPNNDLSLSMNLGSGFGSRSSFCSADEQGLADRGSGNTQCTVDNLGNNASASDRISVSYILEADDGMPIAAQGCNNGQINVPAGGRIRLANTLWTAPSPNNAANGARSLYCQTYNLDTNQALGVALPIVDGIDAIQFQYGIDSINNDGLVDTYQSITAVGGNVAAIKTVRMALLISSGLAIDDESNTDTPFDRTYSLLDAPPIFIARDRKLRQIFSTTVLLPNTI